jgi:hypothetical protein
MKAYLSGGMENAKNYGADWRSSLEMWLRETLRHDVFNPSAESLAFLKRKYPTVDRSTMRKEDIARFRQVIGDIIMMECREIIERCDYLICYWDESCYRGAGTQGEVTIAKYFGKPVYLITRLPISDVPGWVIACSSELFTEFETLKTFLQRKYMRE